MAQGQHDTIAYRLSQTLIKLNQGDHLDPAELAEEFGTHIRTIQRDLKVRLAYLPLLKTRGRYHLEPAYLGKLNFKDIERFAALAGVQGLFPSLGRDALKDLLGQQLQMPWSVRGYQYEDISERAGIFSQLEKAIVESRLLSLELRKDGETKKYVDLQPYQLINVKGIWYLAAVHHEKLKTFSVGKMHSVQMQEANFVRASSVESSLNAEEGIWFSQQSQRVVLYVAAEAADYFKRRNLIPHQKIMSETRCGGLVVETRVGHENQILPIVRYWMPSVKILSPDGWGKKFKEQVSSYLEDFDAHPLTDMELQAIQVGE